MYQRLYREETYRVDDEGKAIGRPVLYFNRDAVLAQILDVIENANIPGLNPHVMASYRRDLEDGSEIRSIGFECEPAFGCGASINVRFYNDGSIDTSDGKAQKMGISTSIGTSGTSRDLAGTMLLADILQQVIRVAASIEAQFAHNVILAFVY